MSHSQKRNPAKCLSHRHDNRASQLVLHNVPSMLSERQAGSCDYLLSLWFDRLGIKPKSIAPETTHSVAPMVMHRSVAD